MMLQRLAWNAIRFNRAEPQRDYHPLARADGGWYPGKHFDPTDIMTDPHNWIVWKQFLIFFVSILCLPVAAFLVVEYVLRVVLGYGLNQSTTIGALLAMVVLQVLMYTYARLAAIEHTEPPPVESTAVETLAPEEQRPGTDVSSAISEEQPEAAGAGEGELKKRKKDNSHADVTAAPPPPAS